MTILHVHQNIVHTDFTFWYKINKKYFFPDPSGRKRITDPFYPAWGKMGHFSDKIDTFNFINHSRYFSYGYAESL